MAGNKRIISEGTAEYRSWSLPEVGKARTQQQDARPLRPPTARDVEKLEKEVREEAFRKGHAEGEAKGYQQGLRRAEAERTQLTTRLNQLIAGLTRPFDELDERVVESLLSLAVSVARHIIRRELKADPEQVMAVVREAVAALPEASPKVRIELNPEDAALVREIVGVGEGDSSWTIVDKPMITRGGCRVSSESSHIDATIERRVAEVVARIMGEERERQGGGGDGEP